MVGETKPRRSPNNLNLAMRECKALIIGPATEGALERALFILRPVSLFRSHEATLAGGAPLQSLLREARDGIEPPNVPRHSKSGRTYLFHRSNDFQEKYVSVVSFHCSNYFSKFVGL
jgi:hypothetical protein